MSINEKGVNLFWENYQKALEWYNSSNTCHWRSKARALEVENALLRDFIQRELHIGAQHSSTSSAPDLPHISDNLHDIDNDLRIETESMSDRSELNSPAVDIDEELLAFYEKTIRHKMERKKQLSQEQRGSSEDSASDYDQINSMGPITTSQRAREMALLYGDDASKILSMELSMQINFDMHCSKSTAQLWPNIPLRLS